MSTEGASRTDSGLRLSRPAMDKCPHFDSLWSFSRNCRQSHVLLWLTDQYHSDSSITSYSARPGESMQAGSCFGSCPVAEDSTDGLGQLIGADEQAIRKLWVLGLISTDKPAYTTVFGSLGRVSQLRPSISALL